jgi:hypothetical protein
MFSDQLLDGRGWNRKSVSVLGSASIPLDVTDHSLAKDV